MGFKYTLEFLMYSVLTTGVYTVNIMICHRRYCSITCREDCTHSYERYYLT